MRRFSWSFSFLMLGVALLAGCVDQDSADVVYQHHWFWGPDAYGAAQLPVFRDSFEVADEVEELEVQVHWAIESGRASIVLTPPGGEAVNRTDAETDGPSGDDSFRVPAEPGLWGFTIPTWRAEDGAFPSGEVRVDVVSG